MRRVFDFLRARKTALAIAAFALAAGGLIWVPKWQVRSLKVALVEGRATPQEVFDRENEARRTLAQVLGGLVILGTLLAAWERVRVQQEGQITDRFTRAVDQLGSDKLDVRLGGIYALERIARDSKKDHWTVMEVLTAYVRERAPWPPKDEFGRMKKEGSEWDAERQPPTDIQAVLTVLGRRSMLKEPERLDLRHADLSNTALWACRLDRADFFRSRLDGATIGGRTRLRNSVFAMASLVHVHVRVADMSWANLQSADLTEAILEGADLSHVDLSEPKWVHPRARKASLTRAKLLEVGLLGADLSYVEGLTQEQVDQAITDEKTKLPDYLQKRAEEDNEHKEPNQ